MIAFIMLGIQYVVLLVFHSTQATDSFWYFDLLLQAIFVVQTLFVAFRLFYFILNKQEDIIQTKNYKLVRIVENIIIITAVILISVNVFFTFFWS